LKINNNFYGKGMVLAVKESKQRRDARFAVTAGTLPSQLSKAISGWQKRIGEAIASKGDLRGDFFWGWI
jgi:hypothetical protein